MSRARSGVLLDTCAVIWLANGSAMAEEALRAIKAAAHAEGIFVSAASAWEIGMLSRPRGGRNPLQFRPDPKTWFASFLAGPAIRLAPITVEIAIDASYLPGDMHADPGDRLIIATARHLGLPIVTRDRRIIGYAGSGFIDIVAC